jgi:adenine specific DNA methylase Mod
VKKKDNEIKLSWNRRPAPEPKGGGLAVAEKFGRVVRGGKRNMLIHGDNYGAMHALKADYKDKIDLIYIDPPYATGRRFSNRVSARNGDDPPVDSEAYDDVWADGLDDYLQMIYDRLKLMRDLLAPTGSIYVHGDWHASHYVKIIMDEIFGRERFQNEIVWCYREAVNSKKRWNRKHDLIYFYSKGVKITFNYQEAIEPHSEATLKKYRHRDENGPYRLMGRGLAGSPIRSARDVSKDWEENHPDLTFRHYLTAGRLPVDYWLIDIVNQAAKERTGYATQKPEKLIERIVSVSSNPGDLVADFFCGSGTLPAVASRLGRRWIACDSSMSAIEAAKRRLLDMDKKVTFDLLKIM